MAKDVELAYDAGKRSAVLTFPNGRTLTLGNVTEEQANNFLARHAQEFMKRDLTLHSVEGTFTREQESE